MLLSYRMPSVRIAMRVVLRADDAPTYDQASLLGYGTADGVSCSEQPSRLPSASLRVPRRQPSRGRHFVSAANSAWHSALLHWPDNHVLAA